MSDTQALLEQTQEIIAKAVEQFEPYAIVAAFSGGNDSMAAYQAAKHLGIKIDALVHINTRTGIQETTEFVRAFAEREGLRYLEGDAGSTYEDYVMDNGFYGVGTQAHSFSYHMLKARFFRQQISRNIRHGVRGRKVLVLNGVLKSESRNRAWNYAKSRYKADPGAKSNIWVNHIWHFDKPQCAVLRKEVGAPRNPVTDLVHRSAECMCGTMQTEEERKEVGGWYPGWQAWLDHLERLVKDKHGWGWGESMPEWIKQVRAGQMSMEGFMPMCSGCQLVSDAA